jgi:hypothetical protein
MDQHYDDENTVQGLREDLGHAEERIRQLEDDLRDALNRIHVLEDRQPDYATQEEPEPEPEEPESDPAVADYLDSLERDALDGPHFFAAPEVEL